MNVVTLYNMALGKVGTRTTVSAVDEGSNESDSCNAFYAALVQSTLRAIPWNFARKQRLLTQLKSSADVPNLVPTPWSYEYAYPSDCLAVRFILPKIAAGSVGGVPIDSALATAAPNLVVGGLVAYSIGLDLDSSDNDIKVILTNQYQAEMVYTKNVTDPNFFDSMFVEALTSALGARVARNITNDKNLVDDLKQEAMRFLKEASAVNSNEVPQVQNPVPDWMAVRGTYSDYRGPNFPFADFDQIFSIA